jgi:hypothetical protein
MSQTITHELFADQRRCGLFTLPVDIEPTAEQIDELAGYGMTIEGGIVYCEGVDAHILSRRAREARVVLGT